MGGVWCRADRGHTTSYDSKGPFSSTISRWTDHVRQVYRKPKTRHRPPKPPQKPIRVHDRLNISPPQLVTEQSSDGWRTATLIVPQSAPIPPPRKKKKRLQELARTAYSMDDINTPPEDLSKSTFSLQERYSVESGLDSRGSSSTMVVTPVLESRVNHKQGTVGIEEEKQVKIEEDTKNVEGEDKYPKDNMQSCEEKNSEGDLEDTEEVDLGDEIIPVEKETMFTYRTLQYSNLGYIDKLSAISEVSAESGFDDRTDAGRYSERSESVASDDILTRDVGLNILEHIHDINSMDQENETNSDVREKTAKSKKEWLENILKDESVPYLLSMEEEKKDYNNELLDRAVGDISETPVSFPVRNLHVMNSDRNVFETESKENKISPSNHESPINHSVLLGLLQKNENILSEEHPYVHEGESIFLKNTKTNIIYKSLSSDNLTDDYDNDYPTTEIKNVLPKCDKTEDSSNCKERINSNITKPLANSSISKNNIDSLIITSKLANCDSETKTIPDDKINNVVSSFEFNNIIKSKSKVSDESYIEPIGTTTTTPNCENIVINIVQSETEHLNNSDRKENGGKLSVIEHNKKGSATSSRRSSLTDSLHEFEISIYDMLKESNKYQDSSDEEESVKTIIAVSKP